jgi:DNA-binding NarL/FixJ family response regulator
LAYKLVDFGAVGEKLSRILSPLIDDINSWKRFQTLSKREKEILKLIAQGHNNKNIGSMLYISENTVRTHRDQIMKKIEARNFNEMISFADAFDLIGAL